MRALLAHRSGTLRQALADGTLAIRPLHGGGNLSYVLAELRDSLASVHAFLDCDQAGKSASQVADEEGLLDRADRTFATLPGAPRESEFEDLIDPAVYRDVLLDQFGVKVDHAWMNKLGKGKWSSRMPFVVKGSGESWDEKDLPRYRHAVAEAVASDPGSAIKVDGESVIVALAEALERKLTARGL